MWTHLAANLDIEQLVAAELKIANKKEKNACSRGKRDLRLFKYLDIPGKSPVVDSSD